VLTKKQQERRDRAERRAEHLEATAEATFDAARKVTEHIPLGQPILVGHHSERRHRRDLAKRDRLGAKAVALAKEADRAAAATIYAGRAITSDDPEANEALTAKLAALEAERDAMKAANKSFAKDPEATMKTLAEWDFTYGGHLVDYATRSIKLLGYDRPFPSFHISNGSARIRDVKKRIEHLKRATQEPENPPVDCATFRLEEDKDAVRIRVSFGDRISKASVARMKARGFRWTPSLGVWQRQLNNSARYAAYETVIAVLRAELLSKDTIEAAEAFEHACGALLKGVPDAWTDTVARLVAR
jgi:hypothetical protein